MLVELNDDELALISSGLMQYDLALAQWHKASIEADEAKRLDALIDRSMDLRRKLWKIRQTAKATLV
jgi:aromatic ring-opening dioxygenase catalytic subunit (LigB family)